MSRQGQPGAPGIPGLASDKGEAVWKDLLDQFQVLLLYIYLCTPAPNINKITQWPWKYVTQSWIIRYTAHHIATDKKYQWANIDVFLNVCEETHETLFTQQ